ncbi:hypothetical protein Tco_0302156, partial [Tanacetum coccineum]
SKFMKDDLEAMDLKWQLFLLVMILLDMINLRWSVTTVISWDTLPGRSVQKSRQHQEARKQRRHFQGNVGY